MKFRDLVEGNDDKFTYMMLSRLQQDNEYFLNSPEPSEKNLWAGNVKDQIKEMEKLYKSLKEKPEWISDKDIAKYKKDMLKKLK
jgi:hypothetical protein